MSCDKLGPRQSRNLISRTTILILASLLIWVGAGRELPNKQNALYLVLGLVGIVAYLGMERAAFRRLQLEYSNTQLLYRLEQRLHAQQDFWAATLGADADVLGDLARLGLTLGPAHLGEIGQRRAAAWSNKPNSAADVLRIPVSHTANTTASDKVRAVATTHPRPA